jgi:hypothetical protein
MDAGYAPNGGTVSLVASQSPSHGILTDNGDNTMTYTPAAGYSGTDTFQYSVDDSADDHSNTYTVNMTVTPNFTSLNSAIISAQTDAGSVTVSADGTDVLPANMWVTSTALAAYNGAITAAQAVASNTSATQVQIDSAITTLASATSTFNSAKQAGTKPVDLTSLNSAIISAQTDVGSVTVSADGTDVLPANVWVTSAALAAYNDAITAAQAVASDTSATQVQINSAITTLAEATSTFNSSKQAGTEVPRSTHSSSPTPVDVTINGSGGSGNSGNDTSASAQIPLSDTDTSTINNVIVNVGAVTVTAPASVLNAALGGDNSSWLKLSQDPTAAPTQAQVNTVAASNNITPVCTMDVDLTRYFSDGTSEPVHQLSGNLTVVIKLTSTQLAQITDPSTAKLVYYNPDTGTFTNMDAVFDLKAGTATFQSNHFSTFVIVTAPTVKLGTVSNLGWDTAIPGKVIWDGVTDASSYNVQLLKDGSVVDTESVAAGTTSYDFTNAINKNGRGTYTFTVKAIGNEISYSDSDAATSAKGYTYSASNSKATIGVTYDSHVQHIGWRSYVNDGALAGTTGRGLRLEAVNIKLTGDVPAGASITYEAHVQSKGWQKPVSNGAEAGTTHKSLRLEAVKITLAGLSGYEVKYRVHVKTLGWLPWQTTVNGTDIHDAAVAGTTGQYRRAEAVEIEIVKISA